jgi:adenine-specific DNA-methyltransferase
VEVYRAANARYKTQNPRILGTTRMTLTDFHSKFFAHELTKRCASDSIEKLARPLVDAQVDLNPHQVQAALFAFRSPLSRGAILADEVGLGKTIEAGLVPSQKWAERKRKLLVITPANLRKQWHQELQEKFFLPSRLLEAKSYNAEIKRGSFRPFDVTDAVVICSYQFVQRPVPRVIPPRVPIDDHQRHRRSHGKVANSLPPTSSGMQGRPQSLSGDFATRTSWHKWGRLE